MTNNNNSDTRDDETNPPSSSSSLASPLYGATSTNEDNNQEDHMEPIVEGEAFAGGTAAPPVHRRQRSRGGRFHSRSESLVESLVDVLATIDEMPVERPGEYHAPPPPPTEIDATTLEEPPPPAEEETPLTSEWSSPTPSVASSKQQSRHRRGHSRDTASAAGSHSSRPQRHARNASLTDIFLDEVEDIREAFVEELDKADEGEKFFLDMGLARQMSFLPEDLVRAAEVLEHYGQEDEMVPEGTQPPLKEPPEPTAIPLSAYLLLASAVVALSSVGPLLNVQSGINPVLKVYWRMSATALCLFPLAAASVYKEGGIWVAMHTVLQGPHFITLLLTAACYAAMCSAFVLALEFTAVGNAVILANSQSILLLIGKIFVGQRILALEAAGAVLAFSGAALCSVDSANQDSSLSDDHNDDTKPTGMTVVGDGLALLSAFAGVFYLTFAKAVRPTLHLYLFMFLIMFCGSTMILICMILVTISDGSQFHISIDRNATTGLWGWMNLSYDRLPLELTMVILCNLLGAMGYVRAMQYFDNLIIAVATLLEPVIATLTAVFLGVGLLPGALGWMGNAMVACGTFAVVYPSASKGGGGGGH